MGLSASAGSTSIRALCLASLGLLFTAAAPTDATAQIATGAAAERSAILRIHGSNTVGAKLAPMLVAGLLEAKGFHSVRIAPAGRENEQRITAIDSQGAPVQALVAAHGTGTGFSGLKDGTADLAAASRPIKPAEAESLAALGNLRSAAAEQVIAIDGLAVIVHPGNKVGSLSVEQVARLFAGEITNWRELGGNDQPIELHARDDQSGTYDTFKELVLAGQGKVLAATARRYESNDALSQTVSSRPGAIGFVGLASVGTSKALSITDGGSQPMPPSTALVATEDYPLSRRLFLYANPTSQSQWTLDFLNFVHSPDGQAIVEKSGYVAQAISPITLPVQTSMPEAYQRLAGEAQRLTVNFRFEEGSAQLDNKAQRDITRLIDYLNAHEKRMNSAVLVGFGDAGNDAARTALLSKLRAMAVRRELAKGGILVKDINGLGGELPVASNSAAGRVKNRRVEVWLY